MTDDASTPEDDPEATTESETEHESGPQETEGEREVDPATAAPDREDDPERVRVSTGDEGAEDGEVAGRTAATTTRAGRGLAERERGDDPGESGDDVAESGDGGRQDAGHASDTDAVETGHPDPDAGETDHTEPAAVDAEHADTDTDGTDAVDADDSDASELADESDADAAEPDADAAEPDADAAESDGDDGEGDDPPMPRVPEDVRKYDRFQKMDGAQYERVNQFLRDRTYVTAREWAMARLCADFRTETGVEMTKIGENLPELVPFMTDTYTPQAVNQARASFEEKVRKAGATFLYGAMSDFFTADELDDLMYEVTEVAKFLLEVEGVDLSVEDELDAEDRISSVMREVRHSSDALRHDGMECPNCGHEIQAGD